jgi:hypothetical protein
MLRNRIIAVVENGVSTTRLDYASSSGLAKHLSQIKRRRFVIPPVTGGVVRGDPPAEGVVTANAGIKWATPAMG